MDKKYHKAMHNMLVNQGFSWRYGYQGEKKPWVDKQGKPKIYKVGRYYWHEKRIEKWQRESLKATRQGKRH